MITKTHTTSLLKLALPLIIGGLVQASLPFTSTLFLSRLGPEALAAGTLVSWFFSTIMLILWGLYASIGVLTSNLNGAQNQRDIANVVRDGLWLTIIITIPTTILVWYMADILYLLGESEMLVNIARPYLHALAWAVLPDFIIIILLQVLIGLEHVIIDFILTCCWIASNIIANYLFIFGYFGIPAYGIAGLGWGTVISYWLTAIICLVYLLSHASFRPHFCRFLTFVKPYYYLKIIKIGLPIGLMWCIEVGFFFILLSLIGKMDIDLLASSQVAMQYISLFDAILVAIAEAVTVRISNHLGANQPNAISDILHSGLFIAFGIILPLVLFAWIFPDYLIGIDFNPHTFSNASIVYYARLFLAIGMGFLLLEAVRNIYFGALKGLQDTKSTLIGSVLSFWFIALPLGKVLANKTSPGAIGFWLALLISGFFGTIFLSFCYQYRMNKLLSNRRYLFT